MAICVKTCCPHVNLGNKVRFYQVCAMHRRRVLLALVSYPGPFTHAPTPTHPLKFTADGLGTRLHCHAFLFNSSAPPHRKQEEGFVMQNSSHPFVVCPFLFAPMAYRGSSTFSASNARDWRSWFSTCSIGSKWRQSCEWMGGKCRESHVPQLVIKGVLVELRQSAGMVHM